MDMSTMTMAMGTAMSDMPTATSASTPMSTSMDSMDMSHSSSMMPASDMAMVFFRAITTPLFSSAWVPSSDGTYAGTCIFLIAFAVIHQILNAVQRTIFSTPDAVVLPRDSFNPNMSLAERLREQLANHPFRMATETSRALFQVVTSGIGYLLMIAVMTMNVGYFLSVLGGIFLGTLIAGRFGSDGASGH
ncbi:Copper transport protein [Fusarium sp. LHS14.1]|nr:Copper transport protein [Fusarium sp. LHS14.1]